MRVPDRCLADLRELGYLVFEGFLNADELAAAGIIGPVIVGWAASRLAWSRTMLLGERWPKAGGQAQVQSAGAENR